MTKIADDFREWASDGRKLGSMETLFAWEAWKASALIEREACAKVCETLWNTPINGMATEDEAYGKECATAIRARGEE